MIDFFNIFSLKSWLELSVELAGIVIPKVGLKKALSIGKHLNVVFTIAAIVMKLNLNA